MVSSLQVHLITEMKTCTCASCKEDLEQHGKFSFGKRPICGEAADKLRDSPLYMLWFVLHLMLMGTKKEKSVGVILARPMLR